MEPLQLTGAAWRKDDVRPINLVYVTNMFTLVESVDCDAARGGLASAVFRFAPPHIDDPPRWRWPRATYPPYPDAPAWQCSVYFFWWAYLRQSLDYLRTAEANGRGPCAALYRAFGNIFEQGFIPWWRDHWSLFAEPAPIAEPDPSDRFISNSEYFVLAIRRQARFDEVTRALKQSHLDYFRDGKRPAITSSARYPVAQRPVLTALFRHLFIHELKVLNPRMHDEDIADIAGITVDQRHEGLTRRQFRELGISDAPLTAKIRIAKRKAVQHDLRMAAALIANVALGRFPCTKAI
jgi:hypothetical protein